MYNNYCIYVHIYACSLINTLFYFTVKGLLTDVAGGIEGDTTVRGRTGCAGVHLPHVCGAAATAGVLTEGIGVSGETEQSQYSQSERAQ